MYIKAHDLERELHFYMERGNIRTIFVIHDKGSPASLIMLQNKNAGFLNQEAPPLILLDRSWY